MFVKTKNLFIKKYWIVIIFIKHANKGKNNSKKKDYSIYNYYQICLLCYQICLKYQENPIE